MFGNPKPVDRASDLTVLSGACRDLLTGAFTLGPSLLSLSGPLKREAKNPEWMARGLAEALEQNQDLLPTLVGALGQQTAERIVAAIRKKYPS
jgi:hypothetical protein